MIQSDHSRVANLAVTRISSYSLSFLKKKRRDLSSFQNIPEAEYSSFKTHLEIFPTFAFDQVPCLPNPPLVICLDMERMYQNDHPHKIQTSIRFYCNIP